MPEVICNTSPLQYLHQVGCLELLHELAGTVTVPSAVCSELAAGLERDVELPNVREITWIKIADPISAPALPLAADLGPGESAVLALALESERPLVVLDDGLGRRAAELLGIPLTGTLGVLISAKKKGLISSVAPILGNLANLGFRVSPATRNAVLKLAGES